MKKKLYISICSCVLVCIVVISVILVKQLKKDKELPIEWSYGSCSIDYKIPEQVVGLADYVFIGYVEDKLDTEYRIPEDDIDGAPLTNYSVTVVENIKGVLTQETAVELQKIGGIAKNGKYISLMEGDIVLEVGELYLFSATGKTDGGLYCGVPNSCVPMNEALEESELKTQKVKSQLINSNVTKFYKTAIKNEIKYNRDRYLSKYDKSGKKVKVGEPYETEKPTAQDDNPTDIPEQ